MQAKAPAQSRPAFSPNMMVLTAMMMALTVVMALTPIGMIRLPMVSITIAHVPILIAAITLGLKEGFFVSLAFGFTSLFLAITAPTGILDPFFVNPLVSVLPRALIPVTAFFVYHVLNKALSRRSWGRSVAVAAGVAVGNLTNTFGVYIMLYLVYARQIFEKTGSSALGYIITAISTTTLIKCVGVVAVCLPLILAIQRMQKYART